jgi:hypothetical protein
LDRGSGRGGCTGAGGLAVDLAAGGGTGGLGIGEFRDCRPGGRRAAGLLDRGLLPGPAKGGGASAGGRGGIGRRNSDGEF